MKNSIYVFSVSLLLVTRVSYSQAIYKNSTDFLSGKTVHTENNCRIKLHELFKKNIIEVKCKDSVYTYSKEDVYGYIDKEGVVSRFYRNEIFIILNPTENILIYKLTSGMGLKNSPIIERYFFSKDAGSEILPLTLTNLESAFRGIPEFTKIIEIYFKTDNELVQYDNVYKMYKINRLMELVK